MVDIFAPAKTLIVSPSSIVLFVPEDPARVKLLKGFVFVIVKLSVALATVVIPVPARNVAVFVVYFHIASLLK